eukprot:scaffold225937_cov24-Tisochrysis_lutea.AAC.2
MMTSSSSSSCPPTAGDEESLSTGDRLSARPGVACRNTTRDPETFGVVSPVGEMMACFDNGNGGKVKPAWCSGFGQGEIATSAPSPPGCWGEHSVSEASVGGGGLPTAARLMAEMLSVMSSPSRSARSGASATGASSPERLFSGRLMYTSSPSSSR